MSPDDYLHQFVFLNGDLYLSLNFTQEGGQHDLKLTPIKNALLTSKNPYSPDIEDGDLILSAESANISLTRIK